MSEEDLTPKSVVENIVDNLTDRRGLRHAWDNTDLDVQKEIIETWEGIVHDIVAKQIEAETTKLREALDNNARWVRAALDCETWSWDTDQREAAEWCHAQAVAVLGK